MKKILGPTPLHARLPFRTAHKMIGELVLLAEKTHRSLSALSLDEMNTVAAKYGARFADNAHDAFDLQKAMKGRNGVIGAPGTQLVRARLKRWDRILCHRRKTLRRIG